MAAATTLIQNERFMAALRLGLPAATAATLAIFFTYFAAAQVYRTSANDPQIQMAEDAAGLLTAGANPSSVVDQSHLIDLSTSLAPWVALYDDQGNVTTSSARLRGGLPQLPAGVFAESRDGSQDRVTLDLAGGVRTAIVVARYTGAQPGFVVAGRSLREVSARQAALLNASMVAWLLTMVAVFGICFGLVPKPVALSER